MPYEVVYISGVAIGVGQPRHANGDIVKSYHMICNTLMEGDKAGKTSEKNAQCIVCALNYYAAWDGQK